MFQTIFGISTETLLGWFMAGAFVFAFLLMPLWIIREVRHLKRGQAYIISLFLGTAEPPSREDPKVTSLNRWKRRGSG